MTAFLPFVGATPAFSLNWTASQTGPYPQAPGVTTNALLSPSGATATQADLTSQRYHHHTQDDATGTRKWRMFSSGLNNEDANGQMVACVSSADNWATKTAITQVLEPQAVMSDTIGDAASRICWPACFARYLGNRYALSSVQSGSGATGLARTASLLNDADGSVGTPFLISTGAYTALGGSTQLIYDATLGPPLMAIGNIYGVWGGSILGAPPTAWTGWRYQGTQSYAEPGNAPIVGSQYLSLLRQTTGTMSKFGSCLLDSTGAQISAILPTNIPNAPSQCAFLKLTDGRYAVILNPNDSTNRANIALGLFDGTSGNQTGVYYIASGISTTPAFAGAGKSGGGAYFGASVNGNILSISCSFQKESAGGFTVDVSAL